MFVRVSVESVWVVGLGSSVCEDLLSVGKVGLSLGLGSFGVIVFPLAMVW